MEKYINNDTLVENEISKLFKSSIICPICKNIYINPVICLECLNVYCKKCVDKFDKNDENNSHKCEKPVYKNSADKNEILSKLKFFCVYCEAQILYSEAEKHHEACCPSKTSDGKNFKNKVTMKKLSPEEIDKLTEVGNEVAIVYITCMLNIIFNFYLI